MAEQPKATIHVEFFAESVEDRGASRKAGRPIFKEIERVRIMFPGDNKRKPVFNAHERAGLHPETGAEVTYAEMYPAHYEAFKKQVELIGDGTPLGELPGMPGSKVKEYKAVNIHTIEAMAGLDDRTVQKLGMGTRSWKDKAVAWLSGDSLSEIEKLKNEIASLKAAQVPSAVDFGTWEPEDIKAFIEDKTGARPKGNPSKDTLVAKANEIVA